MKIRVLHVYRTAFPDTQGGTEEFIRTLCNALDPGRFECTVMHPSRSAGRVDERRVESMRVVRVPELFEIASCNVFLRGLGAFRRLAREADVLHYHFPWPFADVLRLAIEPLPRKPAVLTYHSDIVRQRVLGRLYAPLARRFLRSVHRVVATSQPYADSSPVLRALPRAPDVIPLGMDPARLEPAQPALFDAWRERVGKGFFLFVGVLRYYKGLDVLVRAAAGTGMRVVIAGDGPEGASLRALARTLGADNVQFVGRVSDADKAALFTLCRAFVFPSNRRSEAYGIALLEALAWGRAAISADIGTGTGFVNPDGVTGLHVPPDDADALRAAMQRLEQDDALCERLGAAGRERALGPLSAAPMAEAYAHVYTEIYNGSASSTGSRSC